VIFDYDPVIDFEWYRYIGRAKLGLSSDSEVMRLTMKRFRKRYQAYKDSFDIENLLRVSGKTYAYLDKKANEDEDWF